jgi:hypothetical protein
MIGLSGARVIPRTGGGGFECPVSLSSRNVRLTVQ